MNEKIAQAICPNTDNVLEFKGNTYPTFCNEPECKQMQPRPVLNPYVKEKNTTNTQKEVIEGFRTLGELALGNVIVEDIFSNLDEQQRQHFEETLNISITTALTSQREQLVEEYREELRKKCREHYEAGSKDAKRIVSEAINKIIKQEDL